MPWLSFRVMGQIWINHNGAMHEISPVDPRDVQAMKINNVAVEKHSTDPVLTAVFQKEDEMSHCCKQKSLISPHAPPHVQGLNCHLICSPFRLMYFLSNGNKLLSAGAEEWIPSSTVLFAQERRSFIAHIDSWLFRLLIKIQNICISFLLSIMYLNKLQYYLYGCVAQFVLHEWLQKWLKNKQTTKQKTQKTPHNLNNLLQKFCFRNVLIRGRVLLSKGCLLGTTFFFFFNRKFYLS